MGCREGGEDKEATNPLEGDYDFGPEDEGMKGKSTTKEKGGQHG